MTHSWFAICALALAALLTADQRGNLRTRRVAKYVASGSFLACGLQSLLALGDPPRAAYLVMCGLVLGAVGDVALSVPSQRAFQFGLSSFLLGNVAYTWAFASLAALSAGFEWYDLAPPFLSVPFLVVLRPYFGPLTVPVMLYGACLTGMAITALAVGGAGHPSSGYVAVGGSLFFLSDFFVARDRFVGPQFLNKALGLPLYFAGQMSLAAGIGLM